MKRTFQYLVTSLFCIALPLIMLCYWSYHALENVRRALFEDEK